MQAIDESNYQLGPVLELWQQLTSSTPGLITRKANTTNTATKPVAAGPGAGNKKQVDPVEDFVNMEYEAAGEICAVVDFSLQSLKKVSSSSGSRNNQSYYHLLLGAVRVRAADSSDSEMRHCASVGWSPRRVGQAVGFGAGEATRQDDSFFFH